jgi:hypothetical protein|tara:strand:- start:1502 stop:1861 length:360 start_codon:yes stop_codon:yes gene_type:complete
MDLSSVSVKPYSSLTIKHPVTGVDTDIVIDIYGKDSDYYRDLWQGLLKKAADKKVEEKDYEAESLDIFVMCTMSWVNLEYNGEPLECTPENVRMIYTNESFRWLHEQVLGFVGKRENFI